MPLLVEILYNEYQFVSSVRDRLLCWQMLALNHAGGRRPSWKGIWTKGSNPAWRLKSRISSRRFGRVRRASTAVDLKVANGELLALLGPFGFRQDHAAGCGSLPGWNWARYRRGFRSTARMRSARGASERHVGFVFQHLCAVPPHDGVRETSRSGLRVQPRRGSARTRPASRARAFKENCWTWCSSIWAFPTANPSQLSGGQRQAHCAGAPRRLGGYRAAHPAFG